jgi:hypothetical protein
MKDMQFSFNAGLFIRSQVRAFLAQAKFSGYEIKFHENKGWLSSDFIVKGHPIHVVQLRTQLSEQFSCA